MRGSACEFNTPQAGRINCEAIYPQGETCAARACEVNSNLIGSTI